MGRRKLSDEERRFRKMGSGIPFSRWWPALAMLIAAAVVPAVSNLLVDCTGFTLDIHGRRNPFPMLLAYPCSPFLLRGGATGWLLFALLWVPLPFAVVNWRWATRHRRYWDEVRRREAERRKAKRAADKEPRNDHESPSSAAP
jgi:hypothetical protein